jgi:hypothetical protein
MVRTLSLTLLCSLAAGLAVLPAVAAGPLPSVVQIIFEQEHTKPLAAGTVIDYRFQRTVSDERLLGAPYSDDIKVDVKGELAAGTRAVGIALFTGERGRYLSYPDLTINPLINFYLDRSVQSFSQIAGGDPFYLKGRFKAAFLNGASVEPVEIDYDGRKVPGYRVAMTPFAKDAMASRMQGYEGSSFAMTFSESVPGQVVELVSVLASTQKDAPRLEERISFAGAGSAR